MTTIRRATQKDIQALSKKLLTILKDKEGQFYQENVAKFGIPDEYVKRVFAEETLLKAFTTGRAIFYLVIEDDEIIGFAQTIQRDAHSAELDRIAIFPRYTGRGIGTKLLNQVLIDQKQRGINKIIVNTGKDEAHARRFYEKNGFKRIKEATIESPWGKKLTLVTYCLYI